MTLDLSRHEIKWYIYCQCVPVSSVGGVFGRVVVLDDGGVAGRARRAATVARRARPRRAALIPTHNLYLYQADNSLTRTRLLISL